MPVEQPLIAILFATFLAGTLLLPVPHEMSVERFAASHVALLAEVAHVLALLKLHKEAN